MTIKIERRIDAFPPLPAIAAKVLSVTDNPESSVRDLIQAILPDQSMYVAILKIANSALYGRSERVNSLETAIMVLGFNEVRNIVLGRSVVTGLSSAHTTCRPPGLSLLQPGPPGGSGALYSGPRLSAEIREPMVRAESALGCLYP